MEESLWPFYAHAAESKIVERIRTADLFAIDKDEAITAFENLFLRRLEPGTRGIFMNSGTSALFSAYFALGLEPGSEVIVPAHTFRTTVTPMMLLQLRPVFGACDPRTGGLDPNSLRSLLTSSTRAIVVNHQWGHPVNIEPICAFAGTHGLKVVEDCSHAHGAVASGRPVGCWGDVAVFSCGTTKMVSGGLGGMLVTKSNEIYDRSLLLGQPKHRCIADLVQKELLPLAETGLGFNLRGSPVSALLALEHLERLDRTIEIKNENIRRLDEMMVAEAPYLKAVARQSWWNSGTWYKRPVRINAPEPGAGAKIYRQLKEMGARVELCDRPLSEQAFFQGTRLVSTPIPAAVVGPDVAAMDRGNLLLFDTRDLYTPDPERVLKAYAEAFERVSRPANRVA